MSLGFCILCWSFLDCNRSRNLVFFSRNSSNSPSDYFHLFLLLAYILLVYTARYTLKLITFSTWLWLQTDLMSTWGDHLSISNNTPMMHLTCLECGINKNNSEDMEVHLKREHLNWLPFQCPICLSERASDAEMREHLHSSHRKNMNKFIYVDNVTAKRSLQIMMDRALSHAMSRRANHGSGRMSSSTTISPPAAAVNHLAAAMKAHDVILSTLLFFFISFTFLVLCMILLVFPPKFGLGFRSLNYYFSSVLDNVAALFASDGRIEDPCADPISKKRVLGECSKCQKPVTAGARQMHMFFHLAKDHGTFRFRCLFEGCTVEHYRKDQMENHQSKIHGKIDPEMMEDRSLELFHRCQELSMELIGTKNGSTPGPTAAKAEAAYNAQIAAHKEKVLIPRGVPDEEHPLECRLCHKTMQNRIRGFHILWHMAKDMGINRYICRMCGFGHDRSQSVQVHGKKEHGSEDVVQDRIGEYSDEVKQMSERCFGFQALFAQENKRRSKIASSMPFVSLCIYGVNNEVLTIMSAVISNGDLDDFEAALEHEPDDEQEPYEDEEEVGLLSISRIRKRQSRFPRFGLRRPKSKSKRTEMARLREISMLLGGAQYFKKKLSEAAHCEKCGKITNSRMSEHAYTHMEEHLFLCPHCDLGHQSRELVIRHIREIHETDDRPVDNRLKHARDIKAMIRECYPAYFVDAPIPTQQDIEKLYVLYLLKLSGLDDEPSDDVDDDDGVDYDDDSASEPKLVLDEEAGLQLEHDDEEPGDEEYTE
uniref:C2H2-type domain-containing protein n=1 Tax=Angiostrongylus cantonensis TaxID=6313 RepID=A0A158P606_ANGCA